MATKNIVPNADGEGQLGTSSKSWAQGHIDSITGTIATAAQSNITSLGTLTALTVDNVIVNGTTIGHTSDTDLLTLASASLTVAGKSDITTSVSGFASTITNNKDDSQGVLIRTSDNDGGEYILDLQSSSSATGTDYASKFRVAKGGNIAIPRTFNDTNNAIIFIDSTISSGASTYQGSLLLQAGGAGSASYGSGLRLFGHAHASSPGSVEVGLSAVSGAKFTIDTYGAGGGTDLVTVEGDNGNVTVSTGNLIIGTAGKGIDFSVTANQGVSTPHEILDDYEEGTFTPTFTLGGSIGTSASARYTIIGNMCHFNFFIYTLTIPNDSNEFRISLPVTPDSTVGDYTGLNLAYSGSFNSSALLPISHHTAAHLYFHKNTGNASTILNSDVQGLDELIVSGWYYI